MCTFAILSTEWCINIFSADRFRMVNNEVDFRESMIEKRAQAR